MSELKHLLMQAEHEILSLRREAEILRAKAEVIEVFGLALRAPPPDRGGMSIDVAWSLRRAAEEMDAADKAEAEARVDAMKAAMRPEG